MFFFGEIPNNQGNNTQSGTEQTQTQSSNNAAVESITGTETVTEMVTKYNQMSPSERIDFMFKLNSTFEEEEKLRNNTEK